MVEIVLLFAIFLALIASGYAKQAAMIRALAIALAIIAVVLIAQPYLPEIRVKS